jgi:hypothetical protein
MTITLVPAYGRDYTSKKLALADFNAGKDFKICDMSSPWDGKYCSIRDLSGYTVRIRYKKKQLDCWTKA